MKKYCLPLPILCCLAACVLMVAFPLISEVTGQGRGGQASRDSLPTANSITTFAPHTSVPVSETLLDTKSPVSTTDDTAASAPDDTVFDESDLPASLTVFLHESGQTVTMSLESYLVGVVAAEMPYTFHPEALKAQAVAARTYCLYQTLHGLTHESGADVCSDYSHCAAYTSEATLTEHYGTATASRILKTVKAAVEATAGEILLYDGQPILAVFHSRSYQRTEASENVWSSALPYLTSVTTPEADSISTVSVSQEQLERLFTASSLEISESLDPSRLLSETTASGRVAYLFYGGKGIKATQFRTMVGLRSCSFTYEKTDDGWLFTVHGFGHGVGMSQYGANEMAKNRVGYEEILTHYYTGVTLAKA